MYIQIYKIIHMHSSLIHSQKWHHYFIPCFIPQIKDGFCDAHYIKEHRVFKKYPNALQLILYHRLPINPVSAKARLHK